MKEKIKTILIVTLLTAFCILVYINLYSSQSRKQEYQQFLFSKKEECRQAGEIMDEKMKNNQSRGIVYLESEYAYNEKLNTCLYYGGYTFSSNESALGASLVEYVYDSLANKELMGRDTSSNLNTLSQDVFNKEKKELFNK